MGTIYGNEHKDSLAALYTPEQLENFSCVLKDVCLLPLNLSLWKISQPWQVPERKINDTLIWLVKKGEFEGTVKKRTKQLCAGEGVIVPENTPHAFRFAGQCTQGEAFVIHLHAQNLFHETFHTMFSSPFLKSDTRKRSSRLCCGLLRSKTSIMMRHSLMQKISFASCFWKIWKQQISNFKKAESRICEFKRQFSISLKTTLATLASLILQPLSICMKCSSAVFSAPIREYRLIPVCSGFVYSMPRKCWSIHLRVWQQLSANRDSIRKVIFVLYSAKHTAFHPRHTGKTTATCKAVPVTTTVFWKYSVQPPRKSYIYDSAGNPNQKKDDRKTISQEIVEKAIMPVSNAIAVSAGSNKFSRNL